MRAIVLDTNCLISFVSDRNPAQQEKVAVLFNKARGLRLLLVCHHHVVSEFVYVLTSIYGVSAKKVRQMVAELVAMPGVTYTSDVDMRMLLSLWPEKIPDYGDAVLAAYCKKTKGTRVATFDKKFRRALARTGGSVFALE